MHNQLCMIYHLFIDNVIWMRGDKDLWDALFYDAQKQ